MSGISSPSFTIDTITQLTHQLLYSGDRPEHKPSKTEHSYEDILREFEPVEFVAVTIRPERDDI